MPLPANRRRIQGGLSPRIAVGGISHETNTFSPVPTTFAAFRRRAYLTGDAILRPTRPGRSALGGIVEAAEAAGLTLLPTLFASAPPGGVVPADVFARLRAELIDRLGAHRRHPFGLQGVLLVLHGAMVADGAEDAESVLLRDVRAVVGPTAPLIALLDSHANLSPALVAAADLLLLYDTYPHVDTHERGREAVTRLRALLDGAPRPTTAFRAVPLLAPLPPQRTDGPTPMRDAIAVARSLEAEAGVLNAAIAGGFPFADVPEAGVGILVTTERNPVRANALADRLATEVWSRRASFVGSGLPPDAALDRALAAPPGRPVVLADVADNPGAGAPGDGTHLLTRLLARRIAGAVIGALPDPEAVAAAVAAGVGATLRLRLGGKVDPRGGPPLDLTCRVLALSDGVFTNGGPIGKGSVTRLGRATALRVDGVELVVCERPVQALDPALFRLLGIEPADRRIVALKSSVHFRAAFGPLAADIIEVEAGGLSSSDLRSFPYRRVRRPIAPLDPEVRFLD